MREQESRMGRTAAAVAGRNASLTRSSSSSSRGDQTARDAAPFEDSKQPDFSLLLLLPNDVHLSIAFQERMRVSLSFAGFIVASRVAHSSGVTYAQEHDVRFSLSSLEHQFQAASPSSGRGMRGIFLSRLHLHASASAHALSVARERVGEEEASE